MFVTTLRAPVWTVYKTQCQITQKVIGPHMASLKPEGQVCFGEYLII